jgi:glycosyltransferase involved in cell wall biosynthesis
MTDARRAALIHHWMVRRRGGERALEALSELLPGAPIFTLVHDARRCPAPPHAGPIVTSPLLRLPGGRQMFRVLLPFFPALYRQFDLSGRDLIVSSDACLAKTVSIPAGATHLCYCYSPVRYAWDLQSTYLDRAVPAVLRPIARAVLARIREADRRGAENVDRFVAISDVVAQRIERCYGRESDVVPPPVDTEFFCPADEPEPRDPADRPYLVLGAMVPYKRFEDAVDACGRLGRPLIVAGHGRRLAALRRRAGPHTSFVPDPDDARVRELYRSCRALLFPGEEDFGLVPVEAMACGRPVIAWRRGGAVETVEHGRTGILYDAAGPEGLTAGIAEFEAGEADFDPAQAVSGAARFARERFIERMGAILAALGS